MMKILAIDNIQIAIAIQVTDPRGRKYIFIPGGFINRTQRFFGKINGEEPVFYDGRGLAGITQRTIEVIDADKSLVPPITRKIIRNGRRKTRATNGVDKLQFSRLPVQQNLPCACAVRPLSLAYEGEKIGHIILREKAGGKAVAALCTRKGLRPQGLERSTINGKRLASMGDGYHIQKAIPGDIGQCRRCDKTMSFFTC